MQTRPRWLPAVPIGIERKLPHILLEIGRASQPLTLSTLFDTAASVAIGHCNFHMGTARAFPDAVEGICRCNNPKSPFALLLLSGATGECRGSTPHTNNLCSIIKHRTPFTCPGTQLPAFFDIALGHHVAVHTIMGMCDVNHWQLALEPTTFGVNESQCTSHALQRKFFVRHMEVQTVDTDGMTPSPGTSAQPPPHASTPSRFLAGNPRAQISNPTPKRCVLFPDPTTRRLDGPDPHLPAPSWQQPRRPRGRALSSRQRWHRAHHLQQRPATGRPNPLTQDPSGSCGSGTWNDPRHSSRKFQRNRSSAALRTARHRATSNPATRLGPGRTPSELKFPSPPPM